MRRVDDADAGVDLAAAMPIVRAALEVDVRDG